MQKFKSKTLVAALCVLGLGAAFTAFAPAAFADGPKDCDSNAIIRCGLNDGDPIGDYTAKYNQDEPGDLHAIFSTSTYSPSNVQQNGRPGWVTKDGNVYVEGSNIPVATNAQSLGRQPRPNGRETNIGGRTYYYSRTQNSFTTNSIPAIVLMNGGNGGTFQGAILNSCGNIVEAAAVQSPPPPPAPAPEPPAPLPSTGPAEFLGAGLGLGSLTASGYYYLGSRRKLHNKLRAQISRQQ